MSLKHWLVPVWGLVILVPALARVQAADTKAEREGEAERLVREALHREIYGLDEVRASLLLAAADLAPRYAPAQWHRGYVQFRGQWTNAISVPDLLANDRTWKAYLKRRGEAPDTVAGQLELAAWCGGNWLSDQQRAHLNRVLELEPNHAEARRQLGFTRIGNDWVSREQIADVQRAAEETAEAMSQWQPELARLRSTLSASSQRRRDKAADEIRQIDDARVIPAMESELSGHAEHTALLVVESLGKMSDERASQSLARHAVLSRWQSVRTAAATALRHHPMENYVPTMLASLFAPLESRIEVIPGRQLLVRHSFRREGQEEQQQMILETRYERVGAPGGSRGETLNRALRDAARTALARERAASIQNQQSRETNQRITEALNIATDQRRADAPHDWWNWWNEINEVYVSGEKPVETIASSQQIAMADRVDSLSQSGLGQSLSDSGGSRRRGDCLAEGTLVWTAAGVQEIQDIRTGDMVLSQNPDTGELAYKPVLRTTVRPVGKLVIVEADRDEFETSGGHLFWSAGEGWVKSRNLEPGSQLHTASGVITVQSVTDGRELETYNLVVADFHTYFVGHQKVLCHDNTVRRPTRTVVPGLAVESAR